MQLSDIYRGVTKSEVVAGDMILFWEDKWNEEVFQEKYPRAFSFARELDISVRHLLYSARFCDVFHLHLSMEARSEVAGLQSETLDTSFADGKDVWSCVWGEMHFDPCNTMLIVSAKCRLMRPSIGFGKPNVRCSGNVLVVADG